MLQNIAEYFKKMFLALLRCMLLIGARGRGLGEEWRDAFVGAERGESLDVVGYGQADDGALLPRRLFVVLHVGRCGACSPDCRVWRNRMNEEAKKRNKLNGVAKQTID